MFGRVTHKWLKIPYTLHVRYNQRPKKAKVTLLFLHGIGNSGDSWNEAVDKLPSNVRIVTIDLLGFGNSPRPKWALYNAKTQAKSVLATFLKLRITTPVIIVGHSLGALVAIEMAKRYPLIINSLVLCSPPLYTSGDKKKSIIPNSESILRKMYRSAQEHPDQLMRIAAIGLKYKILNDSFNLTSENADSYMSALGSMIINQTSLDDAYHLKVPTKIIKGTLDPLVVSRNYSKLAKTNPNVTVKSVIAGHEVRGRFVPVVVNAINERLRILNKNAIIKGNEHR